VKTVRSKSPSLETGLLGALFFSGLQWLEEDSLLSAVIGLATKGGRDLYLVGGMVRDICLKMPLSNDYDFVYEGDVAELASEAARALGGSAFILDRANGLYRVAIKTGGRRGIVTMDFLPLRYAEIADDLRRRDFTINAMAIALNGFHASMAALRGKVGKGPRLIDPLGGLGDCEKKILRLAAGEDTLKSDPLRSLRGVSLEQRYALTLDGEAENLIKEYGCLIGDKSISRERIGASVASIFSCMGASKAIGRLIELGLIDAVLPSLNLPARTALPLALNTLDAAEKLLAEIDSGRFVHRPSEMKKVFEDTGKGLSPALVFKLAAFFYDISPSICKASSADEGAAVRRGHGLCTHSADLAELVLKGLAFANKTVRAVRGLLINIERWLKMPAFAYDSPSAMALLFDRLKEETALGPPVFIAFVLITASAHIDALYAMLDYYFGDFFLAPPRPLCTGVEIMRELHISGGETIGRVKKDVEKAILTGGIRDKKGALLYIKKCIGESRG
jgi:tRNA nucleotidyltransferase/poly(A) polymerase